MSDNAVYQNILDMWNGLEPPKGPMTWACLTPEAEREMERAIQGAGKEPRLNKGSGKAMLLGYRNGELVEI